MGGTVFLGVEARVSIQLLGILKPLALSLSKGVAKCSAML